MDKPNTSVELYLKPGCFVQHHHTGVNGVGQKVFLSRDVFATKHVKILSMGWVKRCPETGLAQKNGRQSIPSLFILRQQSRFPGFARFQKILLKGLMSLCCFIYCLEVAMCVHFVVEQPLQR